MPTRQLEHSNYVSFLRRNPPLHQPIQPISEVPGSARATSRGGTCGSPSQGQGPRANRVGGGATLLPKEGRARWGFQIPPQPHRPGVAVLEGHLISPGNASVLLTVPQTPTSLLTVALTRRPSPGRGRQDFLEVSAGWIPCVSSHCWHLSP